MTVLSIEDFVKTKVLRISFLVKNNAFTITHYHIIFYMKLSIQIMIVNLKKMIQHV